MSEGNREVEAYLSMNHWIALRALFLFPALLQPTCPVVCSPHNLCYTNKDSSTRGQLLPLPPRKSRNEFLVFFFPRRPWHSLYVPWQSFPRGPSWLNIVTVSSKNRSKMALSFKHVRNPCDIAATDRTENRTWFTRAILKLQLWRDKNCIELRRQKSPV